MSNHSESSLPLEAARLIRSSPPSPQPTQYSLPPMEDITVKTDDGAAPHDLQESGHKRVNSNATERPTSAQRDRDESDQHSDVGSEHSASDDEDADPAIEINPYDWGHLHERYHNEIKECNREEKELLDEWASLMEYFQVWANSGHEQETERTFQRLQTRTTYVKKEESDLENQRQHYISVVQAFESALNLLKQRTKYSG